MSESVEDDASLSVPLSLEPDWRLAALFLCLRADFLSLALCFLRLLLCLLFFFVLDFLEERKKGEKFRIISQLQSSTQEERHKDKFLLSFFLSF